MKYQSLIMTALAAVVMLAGQPLTQAAQQPAQAAGEQLVVAKVDQQADVSIVSATVAAGTVELTNTSHLLGGVVGLLRTAPRRTFLLTLEGEYDQGVWRIYREDQTGLYLVRTWRWAPNKLWLTHRIPMGEFLGKWDTHWQDLDYRWATMWEQPCNPNGVIPEVMLYLQFPDGTLLQAVAERCYAYNWRSINGSGVQTEYDAGELLDASMHLAARAFATRLLATGSP